LLAGELSCCLGAAEHDLAKAAILIASLLAAFLAAAVRGDHHHACRRLSFEAADEGKGGIPNVYRQRGQPERGTMA